MQKRTQIIDKTYECERALYNIEDTDLIKCHFMGPLDGESPLKECRNLHLKNCTLDLRYPLWHNSQLTLTDCEFLANSRASLWYCQDVSLTGCKIDSIKVFRESQFLNVGYSSIKSDEMFWKCQKISCKDANFSGEYAFLECTDIVYKNIVFSGKYAFQYIKNSTFDDCDFISKDIFWHAENVTIKNCHIKAEYIAWYAKNLTFENCIIDGTQPFCYCQNLVFKNCRFLNADLCFENSSADGNILGNIKSIKNFSSGLLYVDSVGEIIFDDKGPSSNRGIIITKD